MKNCIRYIVCAIALVLTLIIIFDVFADDDDGYKKRHRYRGGSQKNNDDHDDHDDHDRADHLRPVNNQAYKETCGECHFAYQPELLPSASWLKILNQLADHFGEEIEVDPETLQKVSAYLKTNGAQNSSAKISVKIMRSLGSRVPTRITDIPIFRKKHRELNPAVFKRESIGTLANCSACHLTAEQGIYDDDDVKIPR
jgi:hypothetical protein